MILAWKDRKWGSSEQSNIERIAGICKIPQKGMKYKKYKTIALVGVKQHTYPIVCRRLSICLYMCLCLSFCFCLGSDVRGVCFASVCVFRMFMYAYAFAHTYSLKTSILCRSPVNRKLRREPGSNTSNSTAGAFAYLLACLLAAYLLVYLLAR